MFLVFSAHRAARTPAVKAAVEGDRRIDLGDATFARVLRRAASSTSDSFADAQRQAGQLGGAWIVDEAGVLTWDEGKRDAALDKSIAAEEDMWARARPLRLGQKPAGYHH